MSVFYVFTDGVWLGSQFISTENVSIVFQLINIYGFQLKKIIDKPRFKYDIYMVVNSSVGLKMATKYGYMSSVLIYQINCQLFYQLCFPRSFSVKILPCPCPHKPQLTYLFLFTLTKFILPLNADHTMPQGPLPITDLFI